MLESDRLADGDSFELFQPTNIAFVLYEADIPTRRFFHLSLDLISIVGVRKVTDRWMFLHLHKQALIRALQLNLVVSFMCNWEVYCARDIVFLLAKESEVAVGHSKLFFVLPKVEFGPIDCRHIRNNLLLLLFRAQLHEFVVDLPNSILFIANQCDNHFCIKAFQPFSAKTVRASDFEQHTLLSRNRGGKKLAKSIRDTDLIIRFSLIYCRSDHPDEFFVTGTLDDFGKPALIVCQWSIFDYRLNEILWRQSNHY